jgi:hypothetical protein
VDYWGNNSHSLPTLSHFRVNLKWFCAFACMVILYISTNFTFTYKVSKTPLKFKLDSLIYLKGKLFPSLIKSLTNLLCGLLHLVTWSKTRTIRFTAAAGTNLACAFLQIYLHYTQSKERNLQYIIYCHQSRRLAGSYVYTLSKILYCCH